MPPLKLSIFTILSLTLSLYCNAQDDVMTTKQGFITLKVSATKIFLGGSVTISGESGQMKTIKTVEIKITGPKTSIIKTIELFDGKYKTAWHADIQTGDFIITATSSDGKATEEKKIVVYNVSKIETMASENIEETNKAFVKLTDAVDIVKSQLSSSDADEIDKRFKAAKEKIYKLQKFYLDINSANKEIAKLSKLGKPLPDNFLNNLSSLNDEMQKSSERMKLINNYTNHKPSDITVCERLVILNEAAAAFSTVSNVVAWPVSLITLTKNIVVDKVVPYGTDYVNAKGGQNNGEGKVDATKEIAKTYAAAATSGADVYKSVSSPAGIIGDLVSYAADYLLKKYCGLFTGFVSSEHRCYNRNKHGQDWWDYGYKTQAKISLRYPKAENTGNIVKMKGNIEGNATVFSFMQDINKEDDFTKELKGRKAGNLFIEIKPPCLPFATSLNDALGFGAVARAIATPAYFNIPVDAEFNRNTNTIKLFLNPALVDFTFVKTQVLFFDFVPFPLVTYQAFPYEKVFISMNAVVKRSKGYKMTKDADGNLLFVNKDGFHVGSKSEALEIDVKLNIAAKQQ